MILLTINRENAGKREKREFAKLHDAIEFGQRTGMDYEIFDPATGKVIDWNEINVKEEEEWYYDEKEFIWKRCRMADDPEERFTAGEFHFDMFGQSRNLRRAGC